MSANMVPEVDSYCRQFVESIIPKHLDETLYGCYMAEGQIFDNTCSKAQKEYEQISTKYFTKCVNFYSHQNHYGWPKS